jgi:chemotaxis signal transduction protein
MPTRKPGGDLPQRETTDDARGAGGDEARGGDDARDLFVFGAGGQLFAVFAEEVESVGENLRPAPLPFAPPTVLGVVPVRGRMRTALDPLRLLDAHAPPGPDAPPAAPADATPTQTVTTTRAVTPTPTATKLLARLFVALAGDEQLALACDSAEGRVAVRAARLAEAPPDSPEHVRALLEHDGRTVTLLDPSRLFDAAMRGTDRRRRRS